MPILDLHPLVGSSKGSSVGNGAAGTGTRQLPSHHGQEHQSLLQDPLGVAKKEQKAKLLKPGQESFSNWS